MSNKMGVLLSILDGIGQRVDPPSGMSPTILPNESSRLAQNKMGVLLFFYSLNATLIFLKLQLAIITVLRMSELHHLTFSISRHILRRYQKHEIILKLDGAVCGRLDAHVSS